MNREETITLEELQKDYYVNLGFSDEYGNELYLLCEITNFEIEIYTSHSERFGKNVSYNVMVGIKAIDEDWIKQYTDTFGKDEEIELIEKGGFSPRLFDECEFIKKQNND